MPPGKPHIDTTVYKIHVTNEDLLYSTENSTQYSVMAYVGKETFKKWIFSSVAQSCLTLCNPMDCSMQASLSITSSRSLLKLMSIEAVMSSNHLFLCRLLLLPPSIFPSIRIFSSESVLCIRWPEYQSSSFSISPSNEYSGLISFRIDSLDLLAV